MQSKCPSATMYVLVGSPNTRVYLQSLGDSRLLGVGSVVKMVYFAVSDSCWRTFTLSSALTALGDYWRRRRQVHPQIS